MSGRIHLSLGGEVVDIRRGQSHVWQIVASAGPHVGTFVMHRDAVARIFKRAGAQWRDVDPRKTSARAGKLSQPLGPLTLVIDGGPNNSPPIKGLYVIARMAGDDILNTESLVVADRRWLWRTIPVVRRYNVRRPTPERRWIDGDLVALQAQRTEADLTHERVTLNDGNPWRAIDVLRDVLAHLCGADGFVLDHVGRLEGIVQDMVLKDQGPAALRRVLTQIPGVSTYAHPDGKIHLTDRNDGTERAVFKTNATDPHAGSWAVQDRSLSLPQTVYVGFEKEHEVRFDYHETDQTALVTQAKGTPGREEPTLENVAPIPDPKLTVGGAELAMGSHVRILEDLLPAWVADTANQPADGKNLTQANLLRFFLSGLTPLYATYRRVPGTGDALFSRRLAVIEANYRRKFRISPQWMDKLKFVAARRATIVSQETGARARADAYFHHVIKPSMLDLANRKQTDLATKADGYAALLKDATPAPAIVKVTDKFVGIIEISPRVSLTGTDMMVVPGEVSGDFPKASAAAVAVLWNEVRLKATWDLSVVLTGSPSTPNDERRLWWHAVSIDEACAVLKADVPEANGPDRQILCGDSIARFAWLDSKAKEIKKSIWEGTRPPIGLLVNPLEIKDVAIAQAARVVNSLLPRVVGSAKIPLDTTITPTGSLKTVTHGITMSGGGETVAWTRLSAPAPATPPPGVWSMLPERTRKIVARLIEE